MKALFDDSFSPQLTARKHEKKTQHNRYKSEGIYSESALPDAREQSAERRSDFDGAGRPPVEQHRTKIVKVNGSVGAGPSRGCVCCS